MHTQMSLADELAKRIAGVCVFNTTQKKWFHWDEGEAEWRINPLFVQAAAQDVVRWACQGASDSDRRYFSSYSFVRGMMGLAKSDPLLASTDDEMKSPDMVQRRMQGSTN